MTFTRRGVLVACVVAACSAGTGATRPPRGPLTARDWFPLRQGAAWSYDVNTGIGDGPVLTVLSVVRSEGTTFLVRSGARTERYELRGDGVVREGEYIVHDPVRAGTHWDGREGSTYVIRAVDQRRTVGDRTYDRVIEVVKQSPATRIETTTWYALDVGVIEIGATTTSSLGGTSSLRSTLRGFTLGDDTP